MATLKRTETTGTCPIGPGAGRRVGVTGTNDLVEYVLVTYYMVRVRVSASYSTPLYSIPHPSANRMVPVISVVPVCTWTTIAVTNTNSKINPLPEPALVSHLHTAYR